ncbi:MAG: DoxX family protein [Bacteroidota bacterium]
MTLTKKVSLYVLITGYLCAGINHFVHPDGYIHIIPAYIPFPKLMNILSGGFEVLFSLLLISPKTRRIAACGIILMLAAFMPVHIQMVIDAPFKLGNLLVTPLIAWARVFLQPVLMLWAGWYAVNNKS